MNSRYKLSNLLASRYPLFLFLIMTSIVYFGVKDHLFLDFWDDQWMVTNWYTEEGINVSNVSDILLDFYGGQYSPLNQFYYTLLFEIFGYNAQAFHLAGLFLHLLVIIAAYLFLVEFIKVSGIIDNSRAKPLIYLTLFIFSIHPINVEVVAWLSASKVLIYALLYFMSLYIYCLYRRTDLQRYYYTVILLFVLSFLGKEQAISLPFSLIIIDLIIYNYRIKRAMILEKMPFFIISLLLGLITIYSQLGSNAGVFSQNVDYPFYQRVCFSAYSLSEYFIKCILPINLMYVYPFPNVIGEPIPFRYYLYPFCILVIIFWLVRYYKNRLLIFCIAFFVANLCIVIHIVPISRFTIVADRYAYVASIGIYFLMAHCFLMIYNKAKPIYIKNTLIVLLAGYLLYCSTYTYIQNKTWHDSASLKKKVKTLIESRKDYGSISHRP